jgi:tripartite-type tricarboxylate transporter receptor subunit TctC
MPKSRRSILQLFGGIAVCQSLPLVHAFAQSYPVRPINLFVGYAAAGAADITARVVGQKVSEILGQPVIVRNQPGASTTLATETVARSAADGYTLLLIPISTAVYSGLREKLPYNLERDLAPVSLVATGPFLLIVNSSVPARSVKELIELAQSRPRKINAASMGVGSAHHLVLELFKAMAKVDIVHVPYKGAAPADLAVATGEVQMGFSSPAGALALLKSGKIRALAVTSAKRLSSLPSVPTLDESGLTGFDYSAWYGIAAPAGVPQNIIMSLNAAIGKAVQTPEVKDVLTKQGFEPTSSTPEEFAAIISREIKRTVSVAKTAKLDLQLE